MRIKEFTPIYPQELLKAFPIFIEETLSNMCSIEVDAVFDIGSHARGESLPNGDYDLVALFHSKVNEAIVLREYSEDHRWFLGSEEEWHYRAKGIAGSRKIIWSQSEMDDETDQEWKATHETKVSTLYIDLEAFIHILMREPFVIETLGGNSFYDPFRFFSRLQRTLVESCDVEALIDKSSKYAETSNISEMVKLADKYNVPRNWARVMTMGLRRSMGALLLWKKGILSFRVLDLMSELRNMFSSDELDLIQQIYDMAFSEEGVRELLSKWSSNRESTLSEMSELTASVLKICYRIKSTLECRKRLITPPVRDRASSLRDFLEQYRHDHFLKSENF